ncbi:hypothetical protein [Microbacterium aurum]|uniref:hypothetical protein n=1 Tax=Microbacterium aurum TaxID=36805 RepID=UPI0012F4EA9A|nr:hypothetical protein [Microbacterium aurum]MBM7826626.1 hypothetical protein [Microbacterium aurum]
MSHGDGVFTNYCGFQSKAWGTLSINGSYSATFGYTAGCTPAPYYNDKTIGKTFKNATNMYGQSYHDGGWAPGVPSVQILA